jgi:hypothetical protein
MIFATPLCRCVAVSTRLSSGVGPQVAVARAGHRMAVLFRVYAKRLNGATAMANARIEQTLKNGSRRARKLHHACPTRADQHPNQGEAHW